MLVEELVGLQLAQELVGLELVIVRRHGLYGVVAVRGKQPRCVVRPVDGMVGRNGPSGDPPARIASTTSRGVEYSGMEARVASDMDGSSTGDETEEEGDEDGEEGEVFGDGHGGCGRGIWCLVYVVGFSFSFFLMRIVIIEGRYL